MSVIPPDPTSSEPPTLPPTDPDLTRTVGADLSEDAPTLAAAAPTRGPVPSVSGYEILGELGRGGMGVVYRARQVKLKRLVALKMILGGGHAESAEFERFRLEAEAVARLSHANIVQIYEIGDHDGLPFIALELCAGGSLATKLAGTPLPADEAVRLTESLARAMHSAHQARVLHRDLKPANVLLADDGTPKITDFGLAKKLDESAGPTRTGAIMGTPSYMPPEQASGNLEAIGPAADVYSLGAILYECLTGRPPFKAATAFDTILQVLEAEPAPPRLLNPAINRDLETIILKCLAKKPAGRYTTALELAEDLLAVRENRPIKARRPGIVERSIRWVKKQERSAVVAVIAGLAGILLLAGGLWGWSEYQDSFLGRLSIQTNTPFLRAEVVAEYGEETIVPSFSLPTQSPVDLPAGMQRLRLWRPGFLDETFRLEVPSSRSARELKVSLPDQVLWPAIRVGNLPGFRGEGFYELLKVGQRTDVIVIDGGGARRLDGATQQARWTWPADVNVLDLLCTRRADVGDNAIEPAHARMVLLPRDAEGKKSPDLLWASRAQALLLAVSAETGKKLWEASGKYGRDGAVAGEPLVLEDLDGDGVPEVAVTFAGAGQMPRRQWIEVLSGKDGHSLWNFTVNEAAAAPSPASRPLPAHVSGRENVDGKPALAIVFDRVIALLDPRTGKPLFPIRKLPVTPVGRLQLLPGARPSVLALYDRGDELLSAVRIDLRDGEILWQHDLGLRWPTQLGSRGGRVVPFLQPNGNTTSNVLAREPEWPIVAQLDNDGSRQIILPDRDASNDEGWLGVVVLDAATGKVRWKRDLGLCRISLGNRPNELEFSIPGQNRRITLPFRLLAGPSLGGETRHDLYTARVVQHLDSPKTKKNLLILETLSGNDGRTLYRQKLVLPYHEAQYFAVQPLLLGNPGPDALPQLVVPYVGSTQRKFPDVFFFAASNGRLLQSGREFGEPQLADLDGDGLLDILAWRAGNDPRGFGSPPGELHAFPGSLPAAWRCQASASLIASEDGKGVVITDSPLSSWSARDRKPLWIRDKKLHLRPNTFCETSIDLNGDGVPDLLMYDSSQTGLRALSGKDGSLLWEATNLVPPIRNPDEKPINVMDSEMIEIHDLGNKPIIAFCYRAGNFRVSRIWLAALSPKGELLWKTPIGEEKAFAGSAGWMNRRTKASVADLDGDGEGDLVLWSRDSDDKDSLYAFGGKDGSLLWSIPGRPRVEMSGFDHWCQPPLLFAGADGKTKILHALTTSDGMVGDVQSSIQVVDEREKRFKTFWQGPRLVSPQQPLFYQAVMASGAAHVLARDEKFICATVVGLSQPLRGKAEAGLQLILLDSKANVRERRDLKWTRPLPVVSPAFQVADLDGDGKDDVVFLDGEKLVATSAGITNVIWEWPLPAGYKAIHSVIKAGPEKAAVVVLSQDRLYALDGKSGKVRWQIPLDGTLSGVLAGTGPHGETAVVLTKGDTQTPITACLLAPDGSRASPPDGDKASVSRETPIPRCLPWVGEWQRLLFLAPWYFMIFGRSFWFTVCFTLLLALGGWLLAYSRRRSWHWKVAALCCLAGAVGIGLFARGGLLELRYVLLPLPWIVFSGLILTSLYRQQWRRVGWLVLSSVVLSVIACGAWIARDSRTLQPWERYDLLPLVTGWLLGAACVGILMMLVWLIRGVSFAAGKFVRRAVGKAQA